MTSDWQVFPDAEALARAAADRVLVLASRAIAARGVFRLVLAGGTTPVAVYRLLAGAGSDWSAWRIYYGDERCLPPDHPDRNSVMAARAWLDHVPVPPQHVHPIPAELGPEEGARVYRAVIDAARPIDLVLLGMGEDGHTASLFPDSTVDREALVVAVRDAPKPPAERVSLGPGAINDAEEVLILVSGVTKSAAVDRWRRGESLPVATVHGRHATRVFVDEAACGR